MMITNRRAQESGPLQNIFLALLILSAAGFSFFAFIGGLADNYATPELEDESSFTVYQESSNRTTESLKEIRSVLEDADSSVIDIAVTMVGRGFQALINMLITPFAIATSVINSALEVFGLPTFIKELASFAILTIIIFAIIALIMKVRA